MPKLRQSPKLRNRAQNGPKTGISGAPLDKLAQLTTKAPKTPVYTGKNPAQGEDGKGRLRKRAQAKYLNQPLINALINLNSPLKKSYINTKFCCNELQQIGQEISATHYCKNRYCLICNRIRTAKLINGYLPTLAKMEELYFVTLTIPNVPGCKLFEAIEHIYQDARAIQKAMRKAKIPARGIRKMECTYNSHRNDFHPHLHLIVEGKDKAQEIVRRWLQRNQDATAAAQDIREADETAARELFKYFTKMPTGKQKFNAAAMDTIFQAMQGRRVFQPFGGIKAVSEEIEEDDLEAEEMPDIEPEIAIWKWREHDWVNQETGECLTEFEPSG